MTFDLERKEDIFTPENVQSMCQVEQEFLTIREYQDVCILQSDARICKEAEDTITFLFYGAGASSSCPLLSAASVNATSTRLYNDYLSSDPSVSEPAAFFLDVFTPDRTPTFTVKTRSRIELGTPLAGYRSSADEFAEQSEEYQDFYEKVKDVFFDFFGLQSEWLNSAYRQKATHRGLRVKWYSIQLENIENAETILGDLLLTIASIAFVFFWMAYQMKSIFLASLAMFQIVISIPVSIVVYKNVFQIPYFSFLHILVVFLVLGIGADDIFVFYDGWRLSEHDSDVVSMINGNFGDSLILKKRMSIAYQRTISAVFNTSFTTTVAFLATAVSPIMPISTFGILAAVCIIFNFVFVITVFPAVIMCHHLWFIKKSCSVQANEKPYDITSDEKVQIPVVESKQSVMGNKLSTVELTAIKAESTINLASNVVPKEEDMHDAKEGNRRSSVQLDENVNPNIDPNRNDVSDSDMTVLDKFVFKAYLPAMTYEKWRVPVVAVVVAFGLLIFGVIAIGFASQLGPPPEPERWFPEDHMLQQMRDDWIEDFVRGDLDPYVQLFIPFGIAGFERPGFNRFEPAENRGNVKFDDSFDFHPAASQRAFLRACDIASNFACDREACEEGLLIFPSSVRCFLPSFQAWYANRTGGLSTEDPSLSREHFLGNLSEYRSTEPIGTDTFSRSEKQRLIGFVDGNLRYVRIDAVTTMLESTATIDLVGGRGRVDDMTDEINSGAPAGMDDSFGTAFVFVWVEAELGIVQGFFLGLTLCFPVAFLVLIVATSNTVVSFYAIISIGFIVSSVLGVAQWNGWSLGIAEAIAAVIVIGFSVDYVIHLGHVFVDAAHSEGLKGRKERFVHASKKMIPTVLAGAITTFGAALPLFACQLTFFPKMGTIMTSTIAFSVLFSIGFFMGFLLLIGPTGRIGDLDWIAEKLGLARCLERCGCLKRNPRAPQKHVEDPKTSAIGLHDSIPESAVTNKV